MDVGIYHIYYIVFIASAFVLGAIPFGIIWAWLFALGDVRKIGSGNIGATNVLRTGNKLAAFLTLTGDLGKGFIATLLPLFFIPMHGVHDISAIEINIANLSGIAGVAGVAVVVGHCYSPLVGFKGGKGVATGIGVVLGFVPIVNLVIDTEVSLATLDIFAIAGWVPLTVLLVAWFAIAIITRYSSLAAIVSFATMPVMVWLVAGDTNLPLASFAISAIIIWRHRANITRLLKGDEAKIGG